MIHVRAHYICEVGQEKDDKNWRWVLPYKDPCKCTSIRRGGMNTHTPIRSFDPVYVDQPLLSNELKEIREHYHLDCIGEYCLYQKKSSPLIEQIT